MEVIWCPVRWMDSFWLPPSAQLSLHLISSDEILCQAIPSQSVEPAAMGEWPRSSTSFISALPASGCLFVGGFD